MRGFSISDFGFQIVRPTISGIFKAFWGILLLYLLLTAPSAFGIDLWRGKQGDRYVALDTALKWTSLLSRAPADPVLFPERWSSTTLFRMRTTLRSRPVNWLTVQAAYEQRARSVSEGAGGAGGTGFLLDESRIPYRLTPLDAALVRIGSTFSYRHELDRVFAAVHFGNTEMTIGRQAIGWGRGVIFQAADIFVPFTPLESDREWRRGIDAFRTSMPLTDLIALEAVAAVGTSAGASLFAGRIQGFVGDIDGELIFGKRAEDYMYAATASAPFRGAELHGELAFFDTPSPLPGGGAFGRSDLAVKAVIGSSYILDAGGPISLIGEYHYSGFGVTDISQAAALLTTPDFLNRFIRGDTQITGRHAAAAQVAFGINSIAPWSLSWIFSPKDGSGVLTPSVRWLFSDNVTLIGQFYFPYGADPRNGISRSEYGGAPASGLIQLNFYY